MWYDGVISFAGRDGGKMKEYSDLSCIPSTNSMEEIEEYIFHGKVI